MPNNLGFESAGNNINTGIIVKNHYYLDSLHFTDDKITFLITAEYRIFHFLFDPPFM
jgi:hypothetical protein